MTKETAGREKQTSTTAASGVINRGRAAARDVIRSITGRKRAEEALREAEERFRSLFEASFEGICIHEKGVILDANPAFAKMGGYSLSEVVGMPVLDLTAKESRDLVMQKIRSGAQEPYEAVGLRKDGTTFGAELIGKTHTYKGRRVRVTALRDITERKRAEEALRASEERHRQLFEGIGDAVFLFSVGRKVPRLQRSCA